MSVAMQRPTKSVEIWGIEPQTFHMQSERSTTELYPRYYDALGTGAHKAAGDAE